MLGKSENIQGVKTPDLDTDKMDVTEAALLKLLEENTEGVFYGKSGVF